MFKEDLMLGLVADEVLYLKVDEVTIPDYEAQGLGPFVYKKKKERRWRCLISKRQKKPWIRHLIYVNWLRRPIVQQYEPNKKSLLPVLRDDLVLRKK